MNSADLVNLILEKLRRVKFVEISSYSHHCQVAFIWGGNPYTAMTNGDDLIVYSNGLIWESNNYSQRIEGMLNGLVRNDEGELVKS